MFVTVACFVQSAKAGDTAMLAASALGHCDAVQLLVLSGGDPNLPNNVSISCKVTRYHIVCAVKLIYA